MISASWQAANPTDILPEAWTAKERARVKKSTPKKSYHYLVEQIQQKIMDNELKFGDKLPPER